MQMLQLPHLLLPADASVLPAAFFHILVHAAYKYYKQHHILTVIYNMPDWFHFRLHLVQINRF